jgi:tetratricopeptide (TPR) repeat protein
VAIHNPRQIGIRPPRVVCVLGSLAVFIAVSAEAATPADWDACEHGYPPDKKIAACTKIGNNPSETTPDRIKALIQRAFGYKFKNEYDAAYADVGAAIDLDPKRASTYDTRAFMFAGEGEIDRPIADYTAAINLEANGYRYLQRGDLYRKKGDLVDAIADYKLAVAQDTAEMGGASGICRVVCRSQPRLSQPWRRRSCPERFQRIPPSKNG